MRSRVDVSRKNGWLCLPPVAIVLANMFLLGLLVIMFRSSQLDGLLVVCRKCCDVNNSGNQAVNNVTDLGQGKNHANDSYQGARRAKCDHRCWC